MIVELDDFASSHIISPQCRSWDCRDKLLELKQLNSKFKVTLFAIPGEMTAELSGWCQLNQDWVSLAVHGFFHQSNYECLDLAYEDFDFYMSEFSDILKYFVKGFRAPGWQIGDDVYKWLLDNDYWVADQSYNNERRPKELKAFVRYDGPVFKVGDKEIPTWHGHSWNVGEVGSDPNGIYEDFENLSKLVKEADDFKFVSEVVNAS